VAEVTRPMPASIASIAAFKDCLAPLRQTLGPLPAANRQAEIDGVLYLWAGPESWLAVAGSDTPDFDIHLATRCNGLAAVTNQSDGRAIFQIAGPEVRDRLAKLLPIDLHPSAFPTDATAMTLAGHISVQIWRNGENSFKLACFRSFSETLYEALSEAVLF
jgi:heterotetrameric sarcosine oxidase gamma subunit